MFPESTVTPALQPSNVLHLGTGQICSLQREVAARHGHQKREVARDAAMPAVQSLVTERWRIIRRQSHAGFKWCLHCCFVPSAVDL
eukprot:32112-Rhodomonas_salina.1